MSDSPNIDAFDDSFSNPLNDVSLNNVSFDLISDASSDSSDDIADVISSDSLNDDSSDDSFDDISNYS